MLKTGLKTLINKTRKIVILQTNYNLNKIKRNMSQESSKKLKIEENTIGTHSGVFHCDEVMACYFLKQLPEFQTSKIIRTRDLELLKQCEIVVDVGAEYIPEKKRFDHHQKSFNESIATLRPELQEFGNVRLSSAGLIYVHYGERVIQELLKNHKDVTLEPKNLKIIFKKLYKSLIQEIDGIDNGVPMFSGEPLYNIHTSLSNRVGYFNPHWMEEKTEDEIYELFYKAMDYVGNEFLDRLFYYSCVWLPARILVEKAIENRFNVHSSGEIIELEKFCPWKEHLFELEQQFENVNIKFVLFASQPDDFRVICVPLQPSSFICRKFLHKKWRGIRDEELEKISGIPGIRFCHQTGFIGGHVNRDGTLKMAEISLNSTEEE